MYEWIDGWILKAILIYILVENALNIHFSSRSSQQNMVTKDFNFEGASCRFCMISHLHKHE